MAVHMTPATAGKIEEKVNDFEIGSSGDTPRGIGSFSIKGSCPVLIPSSKRETGGSSTEAKIIMFIDRIVRLLN